jgi:hypothetical protein
MKTLSILLCIFLFTVTSHAQQNGTTKPAPAPHTAILKITDDKKNVKDTVDHSKKLPAPDRKSNNNN